MIRSFKVGSRTVTYTLICAKNRTSLLLKALPQGKINLYAPVGYSLREADKLVKSHLNEIDRIHAQMQKAQDALDREADLRKETVPKDVLFKGRRLNIIVKSGASQVNLSGDSLIVSTPFTDANKINIQIKHWLVQEALKSIRRALDKWWPTVKIPYGRVTVREQKTRWGSCSSIHNLNFNWKLIMAPNEALEYVVVHELCHLIHLNHSDKFWAEVHKRLPEYDIWKKWLKTHTSELNFP